MSLTDCRLCLGKGLPTSAGAHDEDSDSSVRLLYFAKAHKFYPTAARALTAAFWRAVDERDEARLTSLLLHGMPVDIADRDGYTALHRGVRDKVCSASPAGNALSFAVLFSITKWSIRCFTLVISFTIALRRHLLNSLVIYCEMEPTPTRSISKALPCARTCSFAHRATVFVPWPNFAVTSSTSLSPCPTRLRRCSSLPAAPQRFPRC